MSHQGDDPSRQRQQGGRQQQRQQQPSRQPQQQQQPPQQSHQQRQQQPQPHQQHPQQRGTTPQPQQGQPSQMAGQQRPPGGSQRQPMQQQSRGQRSQQPAMAQQQQMGQQAGSQGMPQAGGQPQAMSQPQGMGQRMMGRQRGGLEPMRIDEFVQTDVVTCQRDTPIRTIVSMMGEENVGTVIVVDDDQQPLGVLTDRKIALALESTPDIANQEAAQLLDGDVVTGESDMTIMEVLEQMRGAEIRRLPIVDDDGSLEGIISLDDILIHLSNTFDSAGELIEQQIQE